MRDIRRTNKRLLIILTGILCLMGIGYSAFSSNLKISGTSSVSSSWDIAITGISDAKVEGLAEETHTPTWDRLTASMEADLYQKGDSVSYDVTIKNNGSLDATLEDISENVKSTNEAVRIMFTGYTKGQVLKAKSSQIVTVKIEYNPDFDGNAEEGSDEVSVTFNYTQYEGSTNTSGDTSAPQGKHLVTYNCDYNGGSDTPSILHNQYLSSGSAIDLTPQCTKAGYTFLGWNTKSDATDTISSLNMTSNNITLYGIYKKPSVTYKVTYAKGSNVSAISKSSDTCTIPEVYNNNTQASSCSVVLPTITPNTGYTSLGFDTLENSTTGVTGSYALNSNITLYANAKANTYTVKYLGNGSTSGTMSDVKFTYGKANTLTTNAYSKSYKVTYNYDGATGGNSNASSTSTYDFVGWTMGGANLYSKLNLSNKGNTTINSYGTYSINVDNTSGTLGQYANFFYKTRNDITSGADYTDVAVIKSISYSGTPTYYTGDTHNDGPSQITVGSKSLSNLKVGNNYLALKGSSNSSNSFLSRAFVSIPTGSKVTMTFRPVLINAKYNNIEMYYADKASVKNLTTTNNGTVSLYADWNEKAITLPTPTKTGYTFGGWYSDSALSNKVGDAGASYTPTSNVTLYAKWAANSYNISYTMNGGTNYSGAPTSYVYGTGTTINGTPTYSGYTFNGWSLDGTNYAFSQTIGKTATGNKTATAKWCQNCASVSNGSCKLDATTAGKCTYTTSCNTGYTISGSGTRNPSCTANSYTVKFNANGGSGTMSDESFAYGTAKALTANAFTKTGYSFKGWSTSEGSNTVTYTDKQSVSNLTTTKGGVVNLYAVWGANSYTLSYNYNGATGGNTSASKSVAYNGAYGTLPSPTKAYAVTYSYDGATGGNTSTSATANYTFNGWYKEAAFTNAVTSTTTYNTASNSTIYAKFTSASVTLPTPTKTGYTFGGWYSDNALSNKIGDAGAAYTPTSNITLYAKWTINSYYLDLNGNLDGASSGGLGTYGTADVYINGSLVSSGVNDFYRQYPYGTTYEIKNIKASTGHTYGGIYSGSLTGTIGTSHVYVSLKFTSNTYSIGYTLNGGTKGTNTPTSATYDKDVNISNPTKTFTVNITDNNSTTLSSKTASKAQTFAGWSGSNLNTSTAKTGTAASPTTAWTGTKTTNTYFKNLRDTSGTVTMTANWNAVNITLPTVTKSGYTCSFNTSSDGTGTSYASGGTYTPSTTGSSGALYTKCISNTAKLTINKDGSAWSSSNISVGLYQSGTAKYTSNNITNSTVSWSNVVAGTYDVYATKSSNASSLVDTGVNITVANTGTSTVNYYTLTLNKGTHISTVSGAGTYLSNQTASISASAASGYTFSQWQVNSGNTPASVSSTSTTVSMSKATTLTALSYDSAAPSCTISSTSTLKSTSQTATLSCTDNESVTSYYFGTSASPSSSDYTSNSSSSLSTTKSITNASTYYLFAKDNKGNISKSTSKTYNSYTVNNRLLTLTGTKGTYNTTNYEQKSNNTYIAPNGTALTISSVYTVPNSGYNTYKGYSTSNVPSSLSTTNPTLSSNSTYYVWFDRNEYTVSLAKGTGISSVSGAGTYRYGASVTLGATVSTGYTWSKWTNSSGTQVSTTNAYNFTISSNVSYTANANANTYTISYNANGGSGTISDQTISYDSSVTIAANKFTKTGYTFSGWTTKSDGTDDGYNWTGWSGTWKYVNGQYGIASNKLTLYARWTPNTYKIYFSANGGSEAPSAITRTYGKDVTFPATVPTKAGYTFNGWLYYGAGNSSSTATSTATSGSYKAGATAPSSCKDCIPWTANDATYVATWTLNSYTVTYNYSTNGGTSATKTSATVSYGNAIDLTPTATKSGYTFVGWNTNKDATTALSSLKMSASNVTLYAIYRKEAKKITITFNKNNASTQTNSSGTAVSDTTVTRSCTIAAVYNNSTQATTCNVTSPTIVGSTNTPNIVGYNTSSSATSSSWSHNTAKAVSANTTYYAITSSNTKTFTVTFNKNNASTQTNSSGTAVSDSTVTRSCTTAKTYNGTTPNTSCNITSPTIVGSTNTPTVVGYNTSSSATSSGWNQNTAKSISANATYYAITSKVAKTITITFNKNNAYTQTNSSGTAVTDTTVTRACTIAATYNGTAQGTTCSVTSPAIAANTGYTVIGYNTSTSSTTSAWNQSTAKTVSANATYYAITLDKTAPTITMSPSSQSSYVSGGKAVTLTLADSGSGLKASQTISYAWSTSNSTAPTSWSSLTTTNTAGAKSTTVTVPATASSGLTGTYYLWIKADSVSDVSGNKSAQKVSGAFKLDNTNPTVSLGTSKTTSSITAVATASATSGISKYEFSKDGGTTWVSNGTSNTYTFTGLTHKTSYSIKTRITSGVGKQNTASTSVTTNTLAAPTFSETTTSTGKTVTITYPSTSGLTKQYQVNGGTWQTASSTTQAVSFTADGTLVAKVTDGTNTMSSSYTVVIDATAPTVKFGTNGSTTWKKSQSTTVTVTDNIALNTSSLKYLWNQSTTKPSESSFTASFTSGNTITKNTGTGNNWYLWILAKDKAGNTTIVRSNAFYIDNTAPTITASNNSSSNWVKYGTGVVISGKVSDANSGINKSTLYYSYDGSTQKGNDWDTNNGSSYSGTWSASREQQVWVRVADNAGNYSAWINAGWVKILSAYKSGTLYGNVVGPGPSYFRTVYQYREVDKNDSQVHLQWRCYVEVTAGNFGGTVLGNNWYGNFSISGTGTYGDSGWCDYASTWISYGSTKSDNCNANYTNYSGNYYSSTASLNFTPSRTG